MGWESHFYRWFLRELIAAIEAMDLRGSQIPVEGGPASAPFAGGQQVTSESGRIITPRQSNLHARPGERVVSANVAGWYALGDNARTPPQIMPLAEGVFPVRAHPVDILIPPSPPEFAAQSAFARNPFWFSTVFYPHTSLPLDADGFAVVLPAFPVVLHPAGAYAARWPDPPAYGSGLGIVPLPHHNAGAEQMFFYDTPSTGWVPFGRFPSNQYRPGWNNSANDQQWPWEHYADLARPNIIWPYMAGVSNGKWYMRVIPDPASSRDNRTSYLHGADPWTFPATHTGVYVLYANQAWETVGERAYPYVADPTGGMPTLPLTSPPDIETWFQEYPLVEPYWEENEDGCGIGGEDGDRYHLTTSPTIKSSMSAFTFGPLMTGSYPWTIDEYGASLGTELDLMAHQPLINRAHGPVIDTIDAVKQPTTVDAQRVSEDDVAVTGGGGSALVDRWELAGTSVTSHPPDGIIYATPQRRVVDRYHVRWELDGIVMTGAAIAPGDCQPSRDPGWHAIEYTSVGGTGLNLSAEVLQVRFLDWGVCWQEYRVVVRRFEQVTTGFRRNELLIVLQRRNRGGDFITEAGLTNWGLNSQRYLANPISLFRRMRPWDSDPEDATGWWLKYSASDVENMAARPQKDHVRTYFLFSDTPTNMVLCTRAHLGTGGEDFPWYTHDPATPWVGRRVDWYPPGGADGISPGWGTAPDTLAYDLNRADVWYDVLNLGRVGAREAYTTDTDFSESNVDDKGWVHVFVDGDGVPFYEEQNIGKLHDIDWPNLAPIIQGFANGANLYEGEFGTLPVPFAATSRVEVFCGLEFNAADAFAVDVVANPDGGYLAVAIALDWSYRASRGTVNGDGSVTWQLSATGNVVDLLGEADAAEFDPLSPPVQEYAFSLDGWPLPVGRLRSNKQVLAFRAPVKREKIDGQALPFFIRLAGRFE